MKKLSLPVIGAGVAGVLALSVGSAFAIGGAVQPTSDQSVYVSPSSTPAATTTDAPASPAPAVASEVPPVATSAPVAPPAAQAPPATVGTMTEPAAPAPATIPAPQVNPDGSLPEGWSPPRNPGEPPIAPIPPAPPAGPGAPDITPAPRG